MKNLKIPTINESEFVKRIKSRELESMDSVKSVESFFNKKRGYVFKMPKPGDSAILLVSGGIESTITWGLLLEKYKLNVYPLVLHRGMHRKKRELAAVKYFSQYFKEKYPKLFHKPQEYSTHLPPPELEKIAHRPDLYYHPLRKLEHLDRSTNLSQIINNRGILPFTFGFYGVAYANYLFDHSNIKVNTIFSGVAPGDGDYVASQTFSALRATLFAACVATDNYNWQISSLAFEKETGHWLEKHDLIKLGAKIKLPLEHTWSCYRAGKYQCGDHCLTCKYRKIGFKKAGVKDKTHYESDDNFYVAVRAVKIASKSILDKVFSMV